MKHGVYIKQLRIFLVFSLLTCRVTILRKSKNQQR